MIQEQDVIDIRRFLSEFRRRLLETKTDKTLIRLIYESLQDFSGSNLLINRYMRKEESLLYRIETLLNEQQQRNLEESKLPKAAMSLAPTASTDSAGGAAE